MNNNGANSTTVPRQSQLSMACNYVSNAWLPLHNEKLREISEKINSNHYEKDRRLLIDDLKGDYALFTFCMRELYKDEQGENTLRDPTDLLQRCAIEKLIKILDEAKEKSSKHDISLASTSQSRHLADVMTSVSLTETLAESNGVDSSLAYLCAAFRQLGLTFISWNYPHLYESALKASSDAADMQKILSRILGFSPSMLALTLAKQWKLPQVVLKTISKKYMEEVGVSTDEKEKVETLTRLCEIGELFASLNNRELTPDREIDWNKARNEILKHLGNRGFERVRVRMVELCQNYLKALPNLFEIPLADSICNAPKTKQATSLYESNQYISSLPKEAQREMRAFYDMIQPESLSKDSVDLLCKTIIPGLGFSQGCVYLVDVGLNALVPRLAIGDNKLNDYLSHNLVAKTLKDEEPVMEAFRAKTPISLTTLSLEGPQLKFICGALGQTQRAGVLYLVPNAEMKRDRCANGMAYFKSVLRALEDCLGIQ